jgi:glutamate 5-kinase
MHELQAAAAVGQMGLVQAYESAFAKFGLHTAQILLTHDDLADRRRYLNARSTLFTLLALAVIPIINENDTVTTDEIRFGDNDTLGALVTNLIEADVLVLLTDQAGLYTADPRRDPAATLVRTGAGGGRRARSNGRRRGQRPRPRLECCPRCSPPSAPRAPVPPPSSPTGARKGC